MPVSISGRLPASHGLDALFDDLVKNPAQDQLVIGRIKCTKITTLASDGCTTAETRFTAVEPVPPGTADWDRVREIMEWSRIHRTGEVPLPLNE